MTDKERERPLWFTAVSIVLILWALAGVYACYTQLTLTTRQLATLPAAQRAAFSAMPLLVRTAYIVATVGGLAGATLLLARRRLARQAFIVSLAGIGIQFGWVFLVFGGLARLGPAALLFPGLIVTICLGEIWLAGLATRRGWLN